MRRHFLDAHRRGEAAAARHHHVEQSQVGPVTGRFRHGGSGVADGAHAGQ
jgi:hypothetical protein